MECWELLADVLKSKQGWGIKSWSDIAAMAQAVAAGIVGVVALLGFLKWRRKVVGTRKLEVAERVLAIFYELRDVLEWVRDPKSFPDVESKDRPKDANETSEIASRRASVYVPQARLKSKMELFSELEKIRYPYMALFGKDKVKPFDTIKHIHSTIWVDSAQLQETAGKKLRPNQEEVENRFEERIWHLRKVDQIKEEIDAAVTQIEETCRPYLK